MNHSKTIDKSEGRKNTVNRTCPVCGVIFVTRADQPLKRCSMQCFNVSRKTQIELICSFCGKGFLREPSKLGDSKSGKRYCGRDCQRAAFKMDPPNFKTGKWAGEVDYRKLFLKDELVCKRCGYSEFDCCVDIHHIDEDRSNNSRENLIALCSCCHRSLHFKKWSLNDL